MSATYEATYDAYGNLEVSGPAGIVRCTPFPRIVRFTGTTDSGEFGNARCPHCGAPGRYVTSFICDGGKRGAAMAGCLNLFPVAPIAREEMRLREKLKQREKKGWKLNQADTRALEAIEAFYAGVGTEQSAMGAVKAAKMSNTARFRGRR